jgi:hypothetical protein
LASEDGYLGIDDYCFSRFHDLEMQHKGMMKYYKEQQKTMTTIMQMSKK